MSPDVPVPRKKKRKKEEATGPARCSFCERTQAEVHQLVSGMHGNICDFCAGLAHGIVSKEARRPREERIAKRQDEDEDAVVRLIDNSGLASLLAKQLQAHPDLDPSMRAALRAAVARLRGK
jgi:hypothetical protein